MARLTGKTAVVTGGTTGLGFETAKLFLAEGARVIVTGQDEKRLAEAAAALGPGAIPVRADARKLADLDALADHVRNEFDGLDVLFVNAGVGTFGPAAEVSEDVYDFQFDVNVKGAYFTVQKLVGLLKPGASVILNASAAHTKGFPDASVYVATKAAVRSFARSFAATLAPRGIRVNAISPGLVPTAFQAKVGLSDEALGAFEEGLKQAIPLGRAGRPDEIAKTALFLASEDASYITAADLVADGGLTNV